MMTRTSDTPPPSPTLLADQLLASLRQLASADNVAGMARYGIVTAEALGVSMPEVRRMAAAGKRALGRDAAARHDLAARLWASRVHEARIMASLVDDAQMEAWAADLDSWDVCDGLMSNLFRLARPAWRKAVNWQIRQIGERSTGLNAEAIAASEHILAAYPDSRAARWIAHDALRELRGDAVQARFATTASRS